MKRILKNPTFWGAVLCTVLVVSLCSCKGTESEPKETQTTVGTTATTVEVAEPQEETRTYFDVPLSEEVQDCIFDECEKYGLSPAIVVALIEKESQYDAHAIGDNGRSVGLMQIQIRWHLQRMVDLGCDSLIDPCQNVKVGINYLAELNKRNLGIGWVLMAYNGGTAYANKQIEAGNISDATSFVLARAYELDGTL